MFLSVAVWILRFRHSTKVKQCVCESWLRQYYLESGGTPVNRLNGPFRLDCGNRSVDVLRHHVAYEEKSQDKNNQDERKGGGDKSQKGNRTFIRSILCQQTCFSHTPARTAFYSSTPPHSTRPRSDKWRGGSKKVFRIPALSVMPISRIPALFTANKKSRTILTVNPDVIRRGISHSLQSPLAKNGTRIGSASFEHKLSQKRPYICKISTCFLSSWASCATYYVNPER